MFPKVICQFFQCGHWQFTNTSHKVSLDTHVAIPPVNIYSTDGITHVFATGRCDHLSCSDIDFQGSDELVEVPEYTQTHRDDCFLISAAFEEITKYLSRANYRFSLLHPQIIECMRGLQEDLSAEVLDPANITLRGCNNFISPPAMRDAFVWLTRMSRFMTTASPHSSFATALTAAIASITAARRYATRFDAYLADAEALQDFASQRAMLPTFYSYANDVASAYHSLASSDDDDDDNEDTLRAVRSSAPSPPALRALWSHPTHKSLRTLDTGSFFSPHAATAIEDWLAGCSDADAVLDAPFSALESDGGVALPVCAAASEACGLWSALDPVHRGGARAWGGGAAFAKSCLAAVPGSPIAA